MHTAPQHALKVWSHLWNFVSKKGSVMMGEAQLTQKSLENQAASCWSTWQIFMTNLKQLRNLCVCHPHAKFLIKWITIEMKKIAEQRDCTFNKLI